jgi:polyisoprenoid-binding protein YceI
MFGVITIKNISKEISFPFKQTSKDGGILFDGEFKLNRLDFGVGGKSFSMSDELNVELSIFAKKS